MAVTSYTSDGHIAQTQRYATSNGNTATESWLYSYLPATDPNAGLLQAEKRLRSRRFQFVRPSFFSVVGEMLP
jgi:hypothetical protein